jgi:hypothetical protein
VVRTWRRVVAPWEQRRRWWACFGALALAGLAWSLVAPLMTGPDEVAQARRAAAVVRGQLTGTSDEQAGLEVAGAANVLVVVEVPEVYGRTADAITGCRVGPFVPRAPQDELMPLPEVDCPAFEGGDRLVSVPTVQYRNQPTFYAWVGLPTLVSHGLAGAWAMRILGLLPAVALLASAATSMGHRSVRPLAGYGLLACLTPGVLYLTAVSNPAGVEIAAGVSAWAAAVLVATGRDDRTRVVVRLAVALVALSSVRGLGPGFAGAVVASLALLAGRERTWGLLRRREVQVAAGAVVAAVLASLAWLLWLQSSYPLDPRTGTGWRYALGLVPWYLHQSVGVFGSNDSEVSAWVTVAWVLATAGVVVAGLRGAGWRWRAVSLAAIGTGVAMGVTTEGLSLPPIGYFWQGRYALPLVLGGVVVAAMAAAAPGNRPAGTGSSGPRARRGAVVAFALAHLVAFGAVAAHYQRQDPDGAWSSTAIPFAAVVGLHVAATVAVAIVVTSEGAGERPNEPAAPPAP